MKKSLLLLFALVSPFIVGCSKEDDGKPDPIEEVEETPELYDFTIVVKDAQDIPIENAEVVLYDSSSAELASEVTDSNGTVIFKDLEAGQAVTYEVSFDGVTATGNVTVSDQDLSETIVLEINEPIAQSSPIIITGFQADPLGSDSMDGGYEYVQLMALQEIDFSETPYSVVIATNGHVTAKGWAEGGKRTFKMDLTSGVAPKGEFFYVGGLAKAIAGYDDCGSSTDISEANWIRSLDYMEGGDGFGNPPSGLLGHTTSAGVNTADGIAVFEGTEVTPESVPLDAIFYGTKDDATYNEDEQWGYRVPVRNDLYSATHPETGEEQALYGQGTNTTFLTQSPNDNDYHKLGGVTSSTHWHEPRNTTAVALFPCPGESTLSDIEEGEGVTVFLNE